MYHPPNRPKPPYRAVASALGVNEVTVARDLKPVDNATYEEELSAEIPENVENATPPEPPETDIPALKVDPHDVVTSEQRRRRWGCLSQLSIETFLLSQKGQKRRNQA